MLFRHRENVLASTNLPVHCSSLNNHKQIVRHREISTFSWGCLNLEDPKELTKVDFFINEFHFYNLWVDQ